MAILCAITTSCKKEKNEIKTVTFELENNLVTTIENNLHFSSGEHVLFSADQYRAFTFNRFDIDAHTIKQSISFSFDAWKIVTSPDRSKIAFITQHEKSYGRTTYDIFSINIDGTDLKLLTKTIHPVVDEHMHIDYGFTPDNSEIIVYNDSWENFGEGYVIFSLIDSKITKINKKDPKFQLLDSTIFCFKNTGKGLWENGYFTKNQDFLMANQNEIGLFNFKLKTFTKILSRDNPQLVYSWSPDEQKIAFYLEDYKGLFIYDIASKTSMEVDTNECSGGLVWMEKGRKILYCSKMDKTSIYYISLYNLDTGLCEKIEPRSANKDTYINSLSNDTLAFIEDIETQQKYIFNTISKTKEKIQIPDDLQETILDIELFNNNLFILTSNLLQYNMKDKTCQVLYKNNSSNLLSMYPSFDRSNFYLFEENSETRKSRFLFFNTNGKQISQSPYFDIPENSPFLSKIVDPNEAIYVSVSPAKTNLFNYSSSDRKVSNLTENFGNVLNFVLSPNQLYLAILTDKDIRHQDEIDKQYSFYFMKLTQNVEIKQVAQFQINLDSDFFHPVSVHKELTFAWTPDSKNLLFVACDNQGIFSINKFDPESFNVTKVSNPTISSSQINISPDGKKIVYIAGKEKQIYIMNLDGSNNQLLTTNSPKRRYCLPSWTPKLGNVCYYEYAYDLEGKDMTKFILHYVSGTNNEEIKKIECNYILLDNNDEQYREFESYYSWSSDMKFFAFYQKIEVLPQYVPSPYFSYQLNLLANLADNQVIKGDITQFLWSVEGTKLILLDQTYPNQLSLFDCTTNTYKSISQDVDQIFDACWSLDGKEILYSGTDSKTGQIVFKTTNPYGSNQKLLFTFGENPQERPNSIEKIEKLVWLK